MNLKKTQTLKKNQKTNSLALKKKSEALVVKLGGQTIAYLPLLEKPKIRTKEQIVGRALVMNVLIGVAFDFPPEEASKWIKENKLTKYLSKEEKKLLKTPAAKISRETKNEYSWYIESLWPLCWALKFSDELDTASPVADDMVYMFPNVIEHESTAKFVKKASLQPESKITEKVDFFYRAHWFAKQVGRAPKKYPEKIRKNFDPDVIYERRRGLEWVYNKTLNWDEISLDT
jgi:hypothetical protein